MSAPILADLTITEETFGLWCPHCRLSTAVETHFLFTRRARPDLPPLGRSRYVTCDQCERELIDPEIDVYEKRRTIKVLDS